jgi:hypothetical protein|tara:strand:- start:5878 stop:6228 length:351 start_codon:yes stop_codon:yes gene_type:complete
MKIIFKIIEYLPETEQIVVRFCRQNAPKSIDDYSAVAIDCKFIDNSDRVNLIESLFQLGLGIIEKQENEELTLDNNLAAEMFFEKNYENFVGKVIALDTKELKKIKSKRMNRVDIE